MSLLLGAGRTPCLGPLNVLSLLPRRWAGYQLCPAAEAVSRGGTLDQACGQAGVGGHGCSETHVHQLLSASQTLECSEKGQPGTPPPEK